jgi:hypothetical protein
MKKCEKATSPVWKYFLQYQSCHNRQDYVVCRLCHEEENSKVAGDGVSLNYERYEVKYCHSTTKLSRHLQTHHKAIYEELQQLEQEKISKKGISKYFKQVGNSKMKLFKFMIKTYQPISLVEDPSFRELVCDLDDSLAHISRQYVTNTLSYSWTTTARQRLSACSLDVSFP